MKATPTTSRQPEVAGQPPDTGRNGRYTAPADGQHTAPTLAARPRPWPFPPPSVAFTAPKSRIHGRIADGGSLNRASERISAGQRGVTRTGGACCKTVGSAYVGSNPTPATTCEDGPLAGNSRLCGPFLLCPVVCHLVALRAAVSRCPRTYSGRDPCPSTVGAHRRLFHGRSRTSDYLRWPFLYLACTCRVPGGNDAGQRPDVPGREQSAYGAAGRGTPGGTGGRPGAGTWQGQRADGSDP